jgi:hypothetical protein
LRSAFRHDTEPSSHSLDIVKYILEADGFGSDWMHDRRSLVDTRCREVEKFGANASSRVANIDLLVVGILLLDRGMTEVGRGRPVEVGAGAQSVGTSQCT